MYCFPFYHQKVDKVRISFFSNFEISKIGKYFLNSFPSRLKVFRANYATNNNIMGVSSKYTPI